MSGAILSFVAGHCNVCCFFRSVAARCSVHVTLTRVSFCAFFFWGVPLSFLAARITVLATAQEAIAVDINTPRTWALHVQALLVTRERNLLDAHWHDVANWVGTQRSAVMFCEL